MLFFGCFAFGFFLEGDAPVRNLPNKAMMVISTTLNHPEIILGQCFFAFGFFLEGGAPVRNLKKMLGCSQSAAAWK